MAKLPRFQESGLISANVPQLDFASLKEENRYSAAVTESLDRLSQFAFGKAAEQQKESDRLVGIQLRGDYEADIQKRITELDVMVSTGQLTDFTQIQTEVQSLQGYVRTLASVDANQAAGLMQSITASGNALLKKSSDILVKAYGAERDAVTDQTISNIRSNLDAVYQYEQDPDRIKEYEAGTRGIVFSVAAQNPSTLPKKMEEYDKARIAARNNAFVNFFVSEDFGGTPPQRLTKMRSGDVGKFQPIWNTLNEGDRQKIISDTLARYVENVQILETQDKLAKAESKLENSLDFDRLVQGDIGTDEYINRLRGRGYVFSKEELSELRGGGVAGADLQLFGSLEVQARKGLLTEADTEEMAKSRRISFRQRIELNRVIDGQENKDVAEAKLFIANAYVPNPSDPLTRRSHERRAEVTNQLLVEMQDAQLAGKPFNVRARARQLVDERNKQDDVKQLSEARTRLRTALAEAGLNQDREDWTEADLRAAGVDNADVRRKILRNVRAVQDKK